tara:strand:+ start:953 stop:1255 length:303 start_codon:yes stop_codon:yes gene_type:complete
MNAESRPVDGAASHESAGRPFANSKFTGDIDLVAISESSNNPRYEVYLAGWSAGFESQQARIDRLTWERDVLYFVANNKGKNGGDFYTHKTSELWNESVR